MAKKKQPVRKLSDRLAKERVEKKIDRSYETSTEQLRQMVKMGITSIEKLEAILQKILTGVEKDTKLTDSEKENIKGEINKFKEESADVFIEKKDKFIEMEEKLSKWAKIPMDDLLSIFTELSTHMQDLFDIEVNMRNLMGSSEDDNGETK